MEYRRVVIPGGIYFFTINLLNRKSKLLINEIEKLRFAFHTIKKKYPFKIEGIVILPEHIHMIIRLPPGDRDYALRIRLIKSTFTHQIFLNEHRNYSRYKKRERGIWQRRYWEHFIRNDRDFETHLNYIHYNPVKHGYVSHPVDWAYSSIHQYIKSGILSSNWGYSEDFNDYPFGE